MAAGNINLQSIFRPNYPLLYLIISSLGANATVFSLFIFFNSIITFRWSTSLLLFWLFYYFACSLCIITFGCHIYTCRSPTASLSIWPLSDQMLVAVSHCGNVCNIRSLHITSLFFFWLGLTWCSTDTSQQHYASYVHLQRMRSFLHNKMIKNTVRALSICNTPSDFKRPSSEVRTSQ